MPAVIRRNSTLDRVKVNQTVGARDSFSRSNMPRAALHTVGGRPGNGAWDANVHHKLSRPVRPGRCRRYTISNRGRPRQSQVPVFLMLLSDLHALATFQAA